MPSSFSESRSSKRSDDYADARALVFGVIETYADVCSLPRLTTFTITDDGDSKSQRSLQPGSTAIHFKCDVELATEKILADREDLQQVFWQIANGESPGGLKEIHIVQKLKHAYKHLSPGKYFYPPLRRGSVQSQRRQAA